jgi:hypothetical protein
MTIASFCRPPLCLRDRPGGFTAQHALSTGEVQSSTREIEKEADLIVSGRPHSTVRRGFSWWGIYCLGAPRSSRPSVLLGDSLSRETRPRHKILGSLGAVEPFGTGINDRKRFLCTVPPGQYSRGTTVFTRSGCLAKTPMALP